MDTRKFATYSLEDALADAPDECAPDGSDVRPLLRLQSGSMAHFELPARQISSATRHSSIEEIWFFLSGRGQMWRRNEFGEEIVDVTAGVCVTIPVDTCFQFRSLNDEPLAAIGVTMPPWSGSEDATVVDGPWAVTVGAALD